jgi:phosphoserine phosphatase RsbU/P
MRRSIPSVLIIDDSSLDGYMLSAVLRKEGYEVETVRSGEEGIEFAKTHQPDIILLDVVMPGLDGFETCHILKHDGRTYAIPVIFLSGADDTVSRVKGLNGGGVDYIIKPFEREEVLARLRIHLRMRQAFEAMVEKERAQLASLRDAQQSILVQPGEIPQAHFFADYRPLHEAGGDFYDVLNLGELIHGYFIADVCGHDLGAAFITASIKALLSQNFTPLYTPSEIISLLNDVLRSFLAEGVYLTACCARINRKTGRMKYVIAGNPPIISVPLQGEPQLLDAEGDLLGAFEAPYFETRESCHQPGDRLLFLTDGLIEEFHGKPVQRQQGLEHLIQLAQAFRHLPLEEMVHSIVDSVNPHGFQAADDLLLMGVEI